MGIKPGNDEPEGDKAMNESNTPVIHISGTVDLKDYTAAMRERCIRYFLRDTALAVIGSFVVDMGIDFYYLYPALKEGYVTYAEWLSDTWDLFLRSTWLIAAMIVFYALYLIVIKPIQARKRVQEFDPNGFPVTYDFFDDHVAISSVTQSNDSTFRLKYSDVRRKIRETGRVIILSTGHRNKILLYKTVMTGEEAGQVRKLLNDRCPQHKIN